MKDSLFMPAHIQQADMDAAVKAQSEAEIKNAIKRHQERMGHYHDWVKPENIALRWKTHEEAAAKALENAGPSRELLPIPDPLPPYMKGQAPSTIQAMLRNGWKPEE